MLALPTIIELLLGEFEGCCEDVDTYIRTVITLTGITLKSDILPTLKKREYDRAEYIMDNATLHLYKDGEGEESIDIDLGINPKLIE